MKTSRLLFLLFFALSLLPVNAQQVESFPNGTVGVPYSYTVPSPGGSRITTCSITDGFLPDGLSLESSSGNITGTPTKAGDFRFTVYVRNLLTSGSINCSITINDPVCSIGSTPYGSLVDALIAVPANAASPTTIKLLTDITEDQGAVINSKKITFDLNGKNLIFTNSGFYALFMTNSYIDYIDRGAGSLQATSDNCTLNIDGGSCTLTYVEANGFGEDFAIGCYDKAHVLVNGDVVAREWNLAVGAFDGSDVTVTGNVSADGGVAVQANSVFTGDGGTVTVNGNISTKDGTGVFTDTGVNKVTVNGTITSPTYIHINGYDYSPNDHLISTTIPGYLTYSDGISSVWVKDSRTPVCELSVGGAPSKYNSIEEALGAAPDNTQATIKLLTDITSADHILISNKKITFNLNGYNLQFTNGIELSYSNIDYQGKGTFTVASDNDSALFAYDQSTCKLTGATCTGTTPSAAVVVSSAAVVTINGDVSSQQTGVYAIDKGSSITVNGSITASDIGAYVGNGGTVTVNGTIIATHYISLNGNVITIDKGQTDSTNPGYLKYTDGTSTVWVKMSDGAVTITTSSLPTGTVGTPYSQTLTATGDTPITWSIDDGFLPADLALDTNTGEISGTPTSAGTSNFTVKASNGVLPDAVKDFSITIYPAPATVTSVTVSPATVSVQKGKTQQFTATVTGTNKPAQTVKWSISGNVDAGTAVSTSGLLTVAASETSASLIVIATSTVDAGKSGTASVTVTGPPTVTSVTISPATVSVQKGKTQQFTATVIGTNSPAQDVNWSVSGQIDAGTAISTSGLLTVAASETSASLIVIATSTVDAGKSGTAVVTVIEVNTGMDAPQVDQLKAWTENGKLHLSGLTAGRQWSVYNIAGTLMHQAIAIGSEAETVLPAHGVYIVRSSGKQLIINN